MTKIDPTDVNQLKTEMMKEYVEKLGVIWLKMEKGEEQ